MNLSLVTDTLSVHGESVQDESVTIKRHGRESLIRPQEFTLNRICPEHGRVCENDFFHKSIKKFLDKFKKKRFLTKLFVKKFTCEWLVFYLEVEKFFKSRIKGTKGVHR